MTSPKIIPNAVARRAFLHHHDLIRPPLGQDTHQVLQRLGFVQFDSINTVARAHDLILWSREQKYRPQSLRKLADKDRGVFEAWTHDASLIDMSYYPHWKTKFARDKARLQSRWTSWHRGDFLAQTQKILDQIGTHGPVCSGDVGKGEKRGSGGWWDWHPSKTALEYLWRTGDIAVCHRVGIRKYYDLSENVIPKQYLDQDADEAATFDWACATALKKLGFASPQEIAHFFDLVPLEVAKSWVADGLASGLLHPILIQGHDKSANQRVCFADGYAQVHESPSAAKRIRILSPFDPALRNRKRALELFGFDYKIEIFVPAAKRKYGYYVFPVLDGDHIVGRIDIKADRANDTLNIQGYWPEPRHPLTPARRKRLWAELHRIKALADCSEISGWDHLLLG